MTLTDKQLNLQAESIEFTVGSPVMIRDVKFCIDGNLIIAERQGHPRGFNIYKLNNVCRMTGVTEQPCNE